MNVDMFRFAFIIFAFSQSFLAMLLFSAQWKNSKRIRFAVVLMLCISGYILKQAQTPELIFTTFWWFTFICANTFLSSFWLFSISLMNDRFTIKTKHYYIAILPAVLPISGEVYHALTSVNIRQSQEWIWLFKYIAYVVELTFISHSLFIAFRHWQSDLVELRRKWRVGIVSIFSIYTIIVIFTVQIANINLPWFKNLELLSLSLLGLAFNFFTFSLADLNIFQQMNKTTGTSERNKEYKGTEVFNQKHVDRIVQTMETDKLYRQESFTISDLSEHLLLQEYKLRKIINTKLDYRNFNDFLNYYRIKEAAEMLSSNEYIGTPVLSIAMDCGFKAISSFNKSFRAFQGVTPSVFRKQAFNVKD